jgi:hypothetical protein
MIISFLAVGALAAPVVDGAASTGDDTVGVALSEPAVAADGIINGEAAGSDDWPMAGGLMMSLDVSFGAHQLLLDTFLCSSTLIAPDVVLLAAHCVDPEALNYSMTFGFGETEILAMGWTREADLTYWTEDMGTGFPDDAVPVTEARYHADFDIQALEVGLGENHDIALLFLAEPVLDVPLGVLPTVEEAAQMTEGAPVTVVGWGQQVATGLFEPPPAGTYGIKQQGESTIAGLGSYEMQIGAEVSDVRKCHGDSGGPTFFDVDAASVGKTRVVGVTSHAYDETDCNETGGVDTRVDAYLDWIDAELRDGCATGVRSWCEEPGILPADYVVTDDSEPTGPGDTEDTEDSEPVVDTGSVSETGEGGGGGKGCGCDAPGAGPSVGLVVAGLLLALRRRTGSR